MMRPAHWLFLHVFFCFGLVLLQWLRTRRLEDAAATALIALCMPAAGYALCVSMILGRRPPDAESRIDVDALMGRQQGHYTFHRDLDVDRETQVLPIVDSLAIADEDIRRTQFLNTLKKDVFTYADYIRDALGNPDSETSHYAASMLLETKGRLDGLIADSRARVQADPLDANALRMHAERLRAYLLIARLDERSRKAVVRERLDALASLVEQDEQAEKELFDLIDLCIEAGQLDRAERFHALLMARHGESVECYLLGMKLFYYRRDQARFRHMLRALQESDLALDAEQLNQIRFWTGDES